MDYGSSCSRICSLTPCVCIMFHTTAHFTDIWCSSWQWPPASRTSTFISMFTFPHMAVKLQLTLVIVSPGFSFIFYLIIKSFYSLWSIGHPWRASRHYDLQLFLWRHSMIFLFLLFHPLLSFATFSSAFLFFCIPDDSNLMLFSLLLLLLCIMYVQSNSIFFFLSDFLLASLGRFSIVLHL